MRGVIALGALALMLGACTTTPRIQDDGSVCAHARALLGGCGVTLTILTVQQCVGPSEAVAQCVVDNADTCEALAEVRFDQCVGDLLDPVADDPPYEPLPGGSTPLPPPPPDPDTAEDTDALCSDGLDNDADGYVDCDDVQCSQSQDVTVCTPQDTSP